MPVARAAGFPDEFPGATAGSLGELDGDDLGTMHLHVFSPT